MTEQFQWTTPLGRWRGVALNVHMFFWLFAAVVFCVEWHYLKTSNAVFGTGLATVAIVFFMAILHEMAHAYAAVNLGGALRSIVVSPWGGQSDIILPPQPRAQLAVHCAGPFLHLLLFTLGAFLLVVTGPTHIGQLMNPLAPLPVRSGLVDISLIQIATWVNFQMLLVNLLPVAPFDASRIMRSSVLSYNPDVSGRRLESAIMLIGCMIGALAIAFTWPLREFNQGPIQPTWFVLACTGIVLIFMARYDFHKWEKNQDNEFSMLDELMQYDSLEEDFLEAFSDYNGDQEVLHDWIADQAPGSELAERSVAIDEEHRVDVILEKLHKFGIERLTEDERTFLNRISQQYRRRRGKA